MAEQARERQRHFRIKPRVGRRIDVRWHAVGAAGAPAVTGEQRAMTRDISVGGAFVVTPDPPHVGCLIELTLALSAPHAPLTMSAEVRWVADGDELARKDVGMGVRFQSLTPEQMRMLHDYFATLTATVDHDDLA